MSIDRRELLRRGWKFGGALLGIAGGWTSYEALRPLAQAATGVRVQLGEPGDFAAGTATYFTVGRLWLVNTGKEFLALSQRCPHLGCRVPFCESSGRFECPCHGSVFDLAGEYVRGPTPRGLDRFQLVVEGHKLVVDTNVKIEGPARGVQDQLTPPQGPSCA